MCAGGDTGKYMGAKWERVGRTRRGIGFWNLLEISGVDEVLYFCFFLVGFPSLDGEWLVHPTQVSRWRVEGKRELT